MDTSPNLQLAYLMAAQSQKHVTYNEAMRALDVLVQQAVLDKDLAAAPASPADGDRYIVAAGPTGAWAGQAGKIAAYQDGAWAFYSPREGWLAWVADEDVLYVHDGAGWDELAVAGGGGGAALDALGALTPAADRLPYFTGASSAALAPFTSFGRSLVDDADASAARATLGLGTAATQNTGTSGGNVPLLNGANTWSAAQTISYDAGGAAQLAIVDSTRGLSTSFRYNGTAGQGELKIQSNLGTFNVLSIQNLHASGFSAISFYAHDTANVVERAAFGYGNTTSPGPFTGKAYFESSNLTDGVVDGYAPLILVTTGDIPNFGGDGNFVRQEFDSNGDCIFCGRTAGVLNSFLIRHQGGARSYGTIIYDGLDNVEAIQTFNMGWSGASAGSMLNLTNGGSRIAWNTSGLMYGIHLDINNVASGAGSCAMRIAGAPVFFDMTNGSDGPRAQALTVTSTPNGDFIPGNDPGDGKRQFSLISAPIASRPVIFTMRNSYASKEFLDVIVDPQGTNTRAFWQWAGGSFSGEIPLMLHGGGIGIGGNVGTLTSHCTVAAGTTAKSQINLASSTAPSSPINGDVWFDGADLKLHAGGTTYTITKT